MLGQQPVERCWPALVVHTQASNRRTLDRRTHALLNLSALLFARSIVLCCHASLAARAALTVCALLQLVYLLWRQVCGRVGSHGDRFRRGDDVRSVRRPMWRRVVRSRARRVARQWAGQVSDVARRGGRGRAAEEGRLTVKATINEHTRGQSNCTLLAPRVAASACMAASSLQRRIRFSRRCDSRSSAPRCSDGWSTLLIRVAPRSSALPALARSLLTFFLTVH